MIIREPTSAFKVLGGHIVIHFAMVAIMIMY